MSVLGCFRYHKGTDFQANHNSLNKLELKARVVLDTTKVLIFKQITTTYDLFCLLVCCFRYHKGTDFQANHNYNNTTIQQYWVVLDTTKVLIFKQITTGGKETFLVKCCFRYHKGTDFQANHNFLVHKTYVALVVLDTTKVLIFKQITTLTGLFEVANGLF